MQLWGKKGVCSTESEFIMDVNESFQIGENRNEGRRQFYNLWFEC